MESNDEWDNLEDDYEEVEMAEDEDNKSHESKDNNKLIRFLPLSNENLIILNNEYNSKVDSETKKINKYFFESLKNFTKIFNVNRFDDLLKYLEQITIKNNSVCAGVIENIPGWRCVECSTYENSIYCNDCYKNSKKLHENHTVYFLYSSGGMCDCGDPDSLKIFCPQHSGPFTNEEEINNFIKRSFNEEELKKLTNFFDDFFYEFSKYFFLLEDFNFFYNEYLKEAYDDKKDKDAKKDILFLKANFGVIFKNFLDFLRLISQKNIGMLHLLARYFLKNNYLKNKEEFTTHHQCIKLLKDDIQILYLNKEKHICECPFIRLFMSNYREEIKSDDNENEEFLLSFPHDIPLKSSFCVMIFFLYKNILLNYNNDLISNRNQFYMEDTIELMGRKTNLIENTYEIFYEYFKDTFLDNKHKNLFNNIKTERLKLLNQRIRIIENDTKYYSKPKTKKILENKIIIIKKIIDCFCLLHNQGEFKVIYPHPVFQDTKGFNEDLLRVEFNLENILENINMYFNWNNLSYSNEIMKYIIYKILNQEKEGIKQLKENEFSFHLSLYRCFGFCINYFCFNYSIKNSCSLMDSIYYCKQNFFGKEEDINKFVDIVMNDYFKFFGFIGGIKNNFFRYYDFMDNYPFNYINKDLFLKIDFCLIKYLLNLTNQEFNFIKYLEKSNIEESFNLFSDIFLKKNNYEEDIINEEDLNQSLKEEPNKKIYIIKNVFLKYQKIYECESDKSNNLMQWTFLLELIKSLMKDDTCIYYALLRQYDEILSSHTKNELFKIIKENQDIYYDLKNILIETIIKKIISNGNLVDLRTLKKSLDSYLTYIFKNENIIEKIIEELTVNKMSGEKKLFYLKDIYLDNIDMNYYINPNEKSKAQRYIQNFKSDEIKLYNIYYFNNSRLTFDFFENILEKILLNKNNLILFKKIIEILIDNKERIPKFNIKSIKNSIFPIILNYLSNFSCINTKNFIEFKNKNRELIEEIKNLLINSNINNDKELEENIKLIIRELDYYKIIYEDIKGNYNILNRYNYNIKYVQNMNNKKEENSIVDKNETNIEKINNNKNNYKKAKAKILKEKYKSIMKKNCHNFLEKNTDIDKNTELNDEKEKEENENEMMCFYCRNKIELNSWDKPYGKLGLIINDKFYLNCVNATLRNELEDKNISYEKYIGENSLNDWTKRIISCGHYFHSSCYLEGRSKYNNNYFLCPLCLRIHNILIPPLNILKYSEKFSFLTGDKIDILENSNDEILNNDELKKSFKSDESMANFSDILMAFLSVVFNFNPSAFNNIPYSTAIDNIYNDYKTLFNFLENIFYSEGSTFNKRQQIDTLQNIILSLRFLVKIGKFKSSEIKVYIKDNLSLLLKNSEKNNIISNCENMFYISLFEKIILSLSILFEYDELKQTFKYLIYIFLPYFAFGNYLKYLSFNNIILDKIDINNNFKSYIRNNNSEIIKLFEVLLQKLVFIQLITNNNNDNKNDDIIKSFNDYSFEKYLSILSMDNLYLLLEKNNQIIFSDIFQYLPKIFNSNDILFKLYKNDFNNIFNIIEENIKLNNNKEINLTKELIINLLPIKFTFIKFDNKVFDWIENNIEKKCDYCSKHSKYYYICLICGKKVCHQNQCNFFIKHNMQCCGNGSIYIDMDDMRICTTIKQRYLQPLYPLYINENGVGPNGYEMENKFKLSQENLKLTIKNFVSYDLYFK